MEGGTKTALEGGTKTALECKDLWVYPDFDTLTRYYTKRARFHLKGVSFELARGQFTGLAGDMSAGKTTLLLALAGHLKWDKGNVIYHAASGSGAAGKEERESSKANKTEKTWECGLTFPADEAQIRRMTSFVFEHMDCPSDLTGAELAKLIKKFEPWYDLDYFHELATRLSVPETRRFGACSAGMKKRLQLALMMARRPEILVLDEPCGEVDPVGRGEILNLLQEFMEDENHTILMATNMTTDLDRIADRIILLDNGSLVYEGSLEDCKEEYAEPGRPFPTVEELMLAMHTVATAGKEA